MYHNPKLVGYTNEAILYNALIANNFPWLYQGTVSNLSGNVSFYLLSLLPISNIIPSAKIAEELKTMLNIVFEILPLKFRLKSKIITGGDIINAMKNLGFDRYAGILMDFHTNRKELNNKSRVFHKYGK
ncbi:CCAAT-box DNA binding protein subunit B-CBFD_NFYB_HMF [Babesia microti strain RI]|uniref:CCAAT-box DNA binding protein subunit B-CBFD_NFYB_HMF n=1 Tax=Babesia microti (strain RI) TaxID=1133968 RepID=I7J999_BABMR|nr:CCAAT-box DNA binding protein subunit B-CBFD_NFYB_HMF [Babesia microti strain RI]CCF75778.1 CCAAT-box DNA binding protein subunit B-CBFD_NFYB_HMF [Babesia microti strain RI]|eukprot:XP_012650186.1 CCAAT-box DNA binding protein subunit B-CBFD_NFYB_HMF [Babesia microti strain RI]